MKSKAPKPLAMIIILAAAFAASGPAVPAVDGPVEFGGPTVLSQQGQRLKVVVPVRSSAGERASATDFLVRETEVPLGFEPLSAKDFTVMRPAVGDYVVFQSGEVIRAPEVSLIVSVAGDPRSPYRMDLQVPPASASSPRAAGTRAVRTANRATLPTRTLRGPEGDPTLPPK